jgi:DNA-binding CsgD family transcriptional regulator
MMRLIGREREQAELQHLLAVTEQGQGGVVLLAGEAGVGKTRLAQETLGPSGLLLLTGSASEQATPAYGPIRAVLRAYLRLRPDGLAGCGPLAHHLALILPELGPAPTGVDQASLSEAIRCAFEAIASFEPTVVFLDDLQWADNATLEFLSILSGAIVQQPLLIVGAYRTDEIPRGHPLRRLRNDLRRARQWREIALEPLTLVDTAALAAQALGQPPDDQLAVILYERTQGVPFFVEELAAALAISGRLRQGQAGFELSPGQEVPIPDTIRDAVLLRLDRLSEAALRLLETAAVAGFEFDLELVFELANSEAGFEELTEHQLIREIEPGQAAFRHALTREAVYGEISWTRRRALHRQIASHLEIGGAPPELVAEHWLLGRELNQARRALLLSAQKSCQIHAYRDAAQAAQRALELWPEGEDEAQRLAVLDQLGQCAQLCGLLAEAARAWREAAEGWQLAGDIRQFAEFQRRLATVYELQSAWGQVLTVRQVAAQAFAIAGLPGEAAVERLAAAAHLQSAGNFGLALELTRQAAQAADQIGRPDLKARTLGLEGHILAKLGQFQLGLEKTQAGLALALEHGLIGPTAEIYQRLASIFEHAANYSAARETYFTAVNFCEERGVSGMAQFCLACVAVVLHQTGEWQQAISLCDDVVASAQATPAARMVATAMLGLIYACRGEVERARKRLLESVTVARANEVVGLELLCAWGLAIVYHLEAAYESAAEYCQTILACCQHTEERHYAIMPLRWAATFFAGRNAGEQTRACAEALSKIAVATGNLEAVAGLAHALGETAIIEDNAQQATQQFGQALDLLRQLEVPYQHAETELRAGLALVKTGQRETGIQHLVNSYHTARKLGARPLAKQAAQELAVLGERVEARLGRRAAGQLKHGGLTRRQLEVLRQIALGRTNAEIAHALFLSPRTVDMHVADILNRLDCRSRAEAVGRAGELGLLDEETDRG